jgi:acetyl/propionyl-CoA carboxylase alpha subunit
MNEPVPPTSGAQRIVSAGRGEYLVEVNGRVHVVHVAGERGDRWLHWNGQVFRRPFEQSVVTRPTRADARQPLTAPMPATVLTVAVAVGASVKRGDTLIVLEAMKMELPVRADADAVVRAVRCRAGELVKAGAVLVELE